jgi:hypothetical protein
MSWFARISKCESAEKTEKRAPGGRSKDDIGHTYFASGFQFWRTVIGDAVALARVRVMLFSLTSRNSLAGSGATDYPCCGSLKRQKPIRLDRFGRIEIGSASCGLRLVFAQGFWRVLKFKAESKRTDTLVHFWG